MFSIIKRLAWVMALALLTTGCTEVVTEYAYGLQLSAHGAGFGAEGGTCTIEVATFPEKEPWEVVAPQEVDWFDYTLTEGGITFTAEPNELHESRSAALNIVSPTGHFETKKLTISQEAATKINLTTNAETEREFDSEGGSYTFSVKSNYAWEITTTSEWITIHTEQAAERATITVARNEGEEAREGEVRIVSGEGVQQAEQVVVVKQATRAENPYHRLVGKWEITASKWFYSPNGSLNTLDYAPNPSDYYLIFDLEEHVYGESLVMRNFLYPTTELVVRYDKTTGGIIIPFGWTVLSYDVFFYLTLVSSSSFSYASMEVTAVPNEETSTLTPKLPSVEGFNYVGFGLWTYDEEGYKIALGSNYRPTMFPMGDIVFRKQQQ